MARLTRRQWFFAGIPVASGLGGSIGYGVVANRPVGETAFWCLLLVLGSALGYLLIRNDARRTVRKE
jgi:hypothetical protein